MEGIKWRYPQGAPKRVSQILNHELKLIKKLEYEPYFLTVNDIVQFARSRNILCREEGLRKLCLMLLFRYNIGEP